MEPKVVILISGKRKSGKDYIAEKLHSILKEMCQILRISEPIKAHYARQFNLNVDELLSNTSYKEKYRQDMIIWSDEIRKQDPGYFCNLTCEKAPCKDIWIVSDIRRKTDIEWFQMKYANKIKTVRIVANQDVRFARGWIYTKGVDDVVSECDLDDWNDWNLVVSNNDKESFTDCIRKILCLINE